jgi:hypothetical protein
LLQTKCGLIGDSKAKILDTKQSFRATEKWAVKVVVEKSSLNFI